MRLRPRAPWAIEDPWFTQVGLNPIAAACVDLPHEGGLQHPRMSEPLESLHPLATFGIRPEWLNDYEIPSDTMDLPRRAPRMACVHATGPPGDGF